MPDKIRCGWAADREKERDYHDREWGVPLFKDKGQFEFLILESAQAGLSWSTILNKREGYRRCFADFDPACVARYTAKDVERLLGDAFIVHNRKKIEAAVNNARRFLAIVDEYGSFCSYFWGFVDGKPVRNAWKTIGEVPPITPLAEKIANDMKKHGFSFLGPTVIYAHMQATGMVNDHLVSCFRYDQINVLRK